MKTLQNNFTTVEQSKRLLELGVPADSADCIYTRYARDEKFKRRFMEDIISDDWQNNTDFYIPCWSVGQLIWIYCKVTESISITIPYQSGMLCEVMVRTFEHKKKYLDFSKLEKSL